MNRTIYEKLFFLSFLILLFNFIFSTFIYAQNLNMVPERENLHPKIESCLQKLETEYEKGTTTALLFAKSRNVNIDYQNKITVYLIWEPGITADEMLLQDLGVEIIKSAGNVFKVKAPIDMLTTIADTVNGISFIKTPDKHIVSDVQSEGVDLTKASSYHSEGYTGLGVKLAVIDDGFAKLDNAISNGDLPNSVVKIDCTGNTCVSSDFSSETEPHGTGVAEIVYDMAPGANLYLIKVKDILDLWDAKDYAKSNGIKIVNISLMYFNTNFYDGECYYNNPVCSVEDAYTNNILWVNSAGNYANQHYEATFTDTDDDGFHNVSPTNEVISFTAKAGDIIRIFLTWDAWPTTNQDYDLYLFDSSLKLIASSKTVQAGTPPVEKIEGKLNIKGTYLIAIYKKSATTKHLLELYNAHHDISSAVASSSLGSPADAYGAMAVGSIKYSNWATGPQEFYSSQGPTNDGRTKPDIMGPDFVKNYVYGTFPGTSAASPHVAGAAALIKEKNPGFSASELWVALTSTATDMGSVGRDNIYGYGCLNLRGASPTSGGPIVGNGGGGGGCFLATSAYGSPIQPYVKILREFRDRFLIENKIGNIFLKFYYKHSPSLADFIVKHECLRAMVRISLLPVVGVSWIALKIGPVSTLALMLAFISYFVGLVVRFRWRYKE